MKTIFYYEGGKSPILTVDKFIVPVKKHEVVKISLRRYHVVDAYWDVTDCVPHYLVFVKQI